MLTSYASQWPIVLLDLVVQGITHRFCDAGPIVIESADGDVLYHAGLEPVRIQASIELYGTAAIRSTSIRVALGEGVDLPTLFGAGRALYGATARLYVYMGGALEDAVSLASGRVRDPIYGDPEQPSLLSFSVERDLIDRALIPHGSNYFREDSWTSVSGTVVDDSIGRYRPIIIGKPGYDLSSLAGRVKTAPTMHTIQNVAAAPGNWRIEMAGHQMIATEAKLFSANNATSGTVSIVVDIDDLGYTVAYADLATFTGSMNALLGDLPAYAGYDVECHPGITGSGFRGLGDVVVWALSQTSFANSDVDWDEVHSWTDRLNNLGRVDTWITERVSPCEWLKSQVLSCFPVYIADSGRGIYVAAWPFDATSTDVEYEIDTGVPGYERFAPVSWTEQDLATVIQVSYFLSDGCGRYLRRIVVTGDPDESLVAVGGVASEYDSLIIQHPLLEESFAAYGRAELEVELPTVQDAATAGRIAQFLARKHGVPVGEVSYLIPWQRGIPPLGAVCRVTDTPVGFDRVLGVVTGFDMADGQVSIRVTLLP